MVRLPRLSVLAAACIVWSLPALAANAPASEQGAQPEKIAPAIDDTLAGNYLAGRFAEGQRDVGAAARFMKRALSFDPTDPSLQRRTLLLNIMAGRIDTAAKLARSMTSDSATEPFSNLLLAALAIHAHKPNQALKFANGIDDQGLATYIKPLVVAWAHVEKKQRKAAEAALKPLGSVQGASTLYDMHRAMIAEVFGDLTQAEHFYTKVTDSKEGLSLRVVQLLGALYERTGRPKKAKALFERFLSENPGSSHLKPALDRLATGKTEPTRVSSASDGLAEGLFGIASSLERQEAGDTALVLSRIALALKPKFPLTTYLVAGILESDGRTADAIALYRQIPKDSAVHWTARLHIARDLDRIGKVDEAAKLLKTLAAERPHDPTPLSALGDLMRGQQRWKEAVTAYDGAIKRIGKLTPDDWQLLYSRGIAYERANEWPKAEADFLKALQFKPDQPSVLNYLGYSWIEKGMHLDRALAMIQKAVEQRPNDGYIVDSLGWGYYMLGKYHDAVRELEQAVELRSEDPVINDHLGDAYWRVGRHLEATFQWNHSLALKPDKKLKAELERKLREGLVKAATVGPAPGSKQDGG